MKNFKMIIYGFLTMISLSLMPVMVLAMADANPLIQGSNKESFNYSGAPISSFSNSYNFSLAEFSRVDGTATNVGAGGGVMPGGVDASLISGLRVSLFEVGSSTPLGIQSTAGLSSMVAAQLPAGDYRFNVAGDSGGKYIGTLSLIPLSFVTPVPEASTWIMMIFGLGFVVSSPPSYGSSASPSE